MYPTQDQITAPGQRAPDFELRTASTESVRLSDLRGQPVVLAFYPADFSPVCSDQLALYQAASPAFAQYGAQVLGLSADGVYSHQAFAQARGLQFPLLSDWWPHGRTAQAYGAFDDDSGMAARALFVLDADGVVNWSYLSPAGVNPGADGILSALEAMAANGKTMPANSKDINQQASNDKAMNDKAMNDRAMSEMAMDEMTMDDVVMDDMAMNEMVMSGKASNSRASNAKASNGKTSPAKRKGKTS
jgi:peroxiredoxin